MSYDDFLDQANPHGWLIVAEDLHEQACVLQKSKGALLTHIDIKNDVKITKYTANRSMFLLGGFALENAIKAFLVYENPGWVSNGQLSKKLRSHSLFELKQLVKEIPYSNKYDTVIKAFENGLESWARYPCGLSYDDLESELILSEELWVKYTNLINFYFKALEKVLSEGWKGPNGYYCKFEFKYA